VPEPVEKWIQTPRVRAVALNAPDKSSAKAKSSVRKGLHGNDSKGGRGAYVEMASPGGQAVAQPHSDQEGAGWSLENKREYKLLSRAETGMVSCLFDSLSLSRYGESSGELSSVTILNPMTGNSLEKAISRYSMTSHEQ
jgi:hypothetical protein